MLVHRQPGGPEACLCPSRNSFSPLLFHTQVPYRSLQASSPSRTPIIQRLALSAGLAHTRNVVARQAEPARLLGRHSPDRPAMRPDRGKKRQRRDAMGLRMAGGVVHERSSHTGLIKTTRYGPEVRFARSCALPRGCFSLALADPQSHHHTQNAPS